MNPPPSSDVEAPEGTSGTAEARALTLHLEVCRMQAELEVLERRIAQYERAESTGEGPHDPFAERAEDLVQRMVDALYAIGRSEIVESTDASRARADETVADARRRAQEILTAARAELADALTARAEAHDAAPVSPVVDLTEGGDEAEPVVVLAEAVAPPTVTVPVDQPGPAEADIELEAVDEPGAGARAVAEGVDTNLIVTVTGADAVLYPEIVVDVGTVPDTDASLVEAAVVDAEGGATDEVEVEVEVEAGPTDAAGVVGAETDEVSEVEAVEDAPGLLLPPPTAAPEAPAVEQPWLPPTPAPDEPPKLDYAPPVPKGAQGATDRTDEAFDAWLAVAPPPRTAADDAVASSGDLPYSDSTPTRRPWVRPLEAAAALLAVVVLVVLALLVLL